MAGPMAPKPPDPPLETGQTVERQIGIRGKMPRAKLASRRSGTRPTGPRQTRTRQTGRAKLDCNLIYMRSQHRQQCAKLEVIGTMVLAQCRLRKKLSVHAK